MSIVKAARRTRNHLPPDKIWNSRPEKDTQFKTTSHIHWMLNGIIDGYVTGEKAHRWLGFAQGYMIHADIINAERLIEISKEEL